MSVGRPLQFDPEQALQAAMHLFWSQGYETTSLQGLLSTMGLSRSSFYQAFGNKHQLFKECIAHYRETTLSGVRAALRDHRAASGESSAESAASAWDIIESLFFSTVEEAVSRQYHWGCLVMNTATEFSQRDLSIAREVKISTRAFTDLFTEVIQQAQSDGDIPANKPAASLAKFLLSNLSGLHTMLKAGTPREDAKEIVVQILTSLKA